MSTSVPSGNRKCVPLTMNRVVSFFYFVGGEIIFRKVTFPKQLSSECWFCCGFEWLCTVLSAVL